MSDHPVGRGRGRGRGRGAPGYPEHSMLANRAPPPPPPPRYTGGPPVFGNGFSSSIRRPTMIGGPGAAGGPGGLSGMDGSGSANMQLPFGPPVSHSGRPVETPSRWDLEQRAKVAASHAHIASFGTYYPRIACHNNPIIPGLPRPKETNSNNMSGS